MYKDPDGEAVETLLDVVSLGLSIAAFKSDPTLLNGLGVAYDALATATPFLPAGFGIIKNAGKALDAFSETATKSNAVPELVKHADTLTPGPFAKESIPAHRGPPTAVEQKQVNKLMKKYGCHSCGTKDPGTKSGNAIADHQPPQALAEPLVFLPHCNHCKARQGGQVLQELRRKAVQ
jgi:hypothetical protein